MKRIEAFVPSDKSNIIVDELKKINVGGLTIFTGKGQGQGKRPQIESARGTARYTAEYNSIDSIITIVEDSRVDQVLAAIEEAAGTGSRGDGKIFISTVDDVFDIGSKKRGSVAL